jgi:hypothetical protein
MLTIKSSINTIFSSRTIIIMAILSKIEMTYGSVWQITLGLVVVS